MMRNTNQPRQHPTKPSPHAWRGFSLLELVVVIAIIAISGTIAAPRYFSSLAYYRVDATANRIAADLALTRESARAASAVRTIEFFVDEGRYQIQKVRALDPHQTSYNVRIDEAPYNAIIVSADFNGSDQADFNGFGVPVHGGTIVVQAGDHQRTIYLDADTGETKIQ